MRFEATYTFWVVTDPGPDSDLADCCYKASLHDLYLQIKGGFAMDGHPTLFTDETEARAEASRRLWARELTAAIREAPRILPVDSVRKLRLMDGTGKTVLDIDLIPVPGAKPVSSDEGG